MTPEITGHSDDTIEIDGDIYDAFDCFFTAGAVGKDNEPYVLACSDGTVLSVKYDSKGIWRFGTLEEGELFDHIDRGNAEEDTFDVAHFKDGLRWVLLGKEADLRA